MLGQANTAYAANNLDEALRILEEVIRIDSNVSVAWQILGQIHKEKGNNERALIAWMSAATIRRKDADLWLACAKLSEEAELLIQADYCYNQVIHERPGEVEAIWDRAQLLKKLGRTKKVTASPIDS